MKTRKCGHPLTVDNTCPHTRGCLTCKRDRDRERQRRNKAAERAARSPASRIHPRVLALIEECRPAYEAALASAKLSPLVLGRAAQ